MARTTSRPTLRLLGFAVAVVAVLAVLRPWSVRPLHTTAPAAFAAAEYAEQVWPRIVDEATRHAVDLTGASNAVRPQAGDGPNRKSLFLRATGTVSEIDRRSRVGVARVQLADGAAPHVIAVQVGPVFRGTALRDAASFIRFTDFANQFDFAAVSNGLHARVLEQVVGPLDLDALVGKRVVVLGAATVPTQGSASSLELVPIRIQAEGATQ